MTAPVSPRARLLPGLLVSVAAGALAALLGLSGGCALSTGGIPAPDAGTSCTRASDCDDNDPCTDDACNAGGACAHTPVADGKAPDAVQTAGDCKVIQCAGGIASKVADDTDVPASTGDCVVNECSMGTLLTDQTKNNGNPCTPGGTSGGHGGTCADGQCVVMCTKDADCALSPPNPCVTPGCDGATATCKYSAIADMTPTPGVTQTPGDCHEHLCVGGQDVNQEDDKDLPPSMGDCQDPVCNAGVPGQDPHAADSTCSTYMGTMPGFCDGAGACVECMQDSECPGTLDDCQHPTCSNHACTTTFTPASTATTSSPPQVPRDCQKIVCDGSGGTQTIADPTDTPDDANVCTTDTCSGSTPVHTPNPGMMCAGTASMPELCNAAGQCGCASNADCTSPNTCGGGNPGTPGYCGCTKTTCAAKTTTCGSISDACFSSLDCNDAKQDGTETDVDCGGVASAGATCALTCAAGKKCVAGSDCASGHCVDGVCCNTSCTGTCQACTAAKKGQGSDGVCGSIKLGGDPDGECPAGTMASCGNAGGCNGSGACSLWPSTTVCVAATCAGSTLTNAETCDGTGTCTVPVPPTTDCSPYTCAGGACTKTCTSAAQCASTAYCDAGTSTCHTLIATGNACSADLQCSSGHCVDGVCCGSACNTGACVACSAALTGGANGTCAPVVAGKPDPRGICLATSPASCGTDGNCAAGSACEMWPATTTCSKVVSCASPGMITTDTLCNGAGVCSGGPTTGPCPGGFACSSGSACYTACGAGAAANDAACAPGSYCDGQGAGSCVAKKADGGSCTADDQCVDGPCLGGSCCTSACLNVGTTCGATGCVSGASGGACVYPGATTSCGTPSCNGGMISPATCDGAGGCDTTPAPCGGGYLCASTTACASACGTMAGDFGCQATYYCDGQGAGACVMKAGAGTACSNDYECLNGCNTGTSTCK